MKKRVEDPSKQLAEALVRYPIIKFALGDEVKSVRKIDSVWRKENLLLHVQCAHGSYVLKILPQEKESELRRLRLMKKTYGNLFPTVLAEGSDAYLMTYVEGKNFFDLPDQERVGRMAQLGTTLNEKWNGGNYPIVDIRDKVAKGFGRYRTSRARFFKEDELTEVDLSQFQEVPDRPSHNDLNCANALFNDKVNLIDPSEEGYNDVGRDIGRYLASAFFNYYDRFGNNGTKSLDIAQAFLSPFDNHLQARAKFYTGESFLSFLRFETISVPKSRLKDWAVRTLTSEKPLLKTLEECV